VSTKPWVVHFKVFEPLINENTFSTSATEMLFIKAIRGADARGKRVPDGFVVFKGSEIANDYLFNSPSTAAAIIMGRSANGLVEWKGKNGQELKNHRS
jgi:hypothetical protein